MRVLASCAAYRSVEPATVASMVKLSLSPPDNVELLGYALVHGYGTVKNVETIFDTFLAGDGEVLVYHDADMVFEPEDVGALVAAVQWAQHTYTVPPVVAAVYPSARNPRVLVGHANGAQSSFSWHGRMQTIARADRTGFGLIAISRAALELLEKPRSVEKWDGTEFTTQDTVFGQRVEAAGGYLWLSKGAGTIRHHVVQLLTAGELG